MEHQSHGKRFRVVRSIKPQQQALWWVTFLRASLCYGMGSLLFFVLGEYPTPAATLWVNPGESIQAAIDLADEGDTVKVWPGTYVEDIHYRGRNITVTSTNPEDPSVVTTTIIDGNRGGLMLSSASSVVTIDMGEGPDCVLAGFTVTKGFTYEGGGLHISSSSPTIRNCAIRANRVEMNSDIPRGLYGGYGGGVYCLDSSPALTGCTIADNEARSLGLGATRYAQGGGIFCSNSSVKVDHCTISGNEIGRYGGISLQDPPPGGGGVYCIGNSSLVLDGCFISGNDAQIGAGVCIKSSSAILTNCVIVENVAWTSLGSGEGHGGGAYISLSTATLTNCTIRGNQGSNSGGGEVDGIGVYTTGSDVHATNCILWDNESDDVAGPSLPDLTYSCMQSLIPGVGNISENPRFSYTYGLMSNSPCIDSGTEVALTEDIDGRPRPADVPGIGRDGTGDEYDMGAYERPAPPEPPSGVSNWELLK